MAGHTVEKIGGTSMLQTEALLENVLLAGREGAALYNRVFVVSAYAGITNKLLEHKKTGEAGVYALFADAGPEEAWNAALDGVARAMRELNARVLPDSADRNEADAFVEERILGVRNCLVDLHRLCSYGHFRLEEHLLTVREMISALGEAHSAFNTTLLLRRRGVNALLVDLTGWRDESQPRLDERIGNAFQDIDLATTLPIVSGYAQCREALMGTYDRGYTEVTFSRVAVLTGAREAIIHKEHHLCSADPRIVGIDKVQVIGRTNYDVADQLSNMGMEAIHPRAAKGLRQAGIPLRVKNTFRPDEEGTLIVGTRGTAEPGVEIVTGLKGVFAFEFFEQDMVGVKGYDAAILDALKRHRVRIVAKTSNANTITHFLEGSLKSIRRVEHDLTERYSSAAIATRKVAIVSAIGRNLRIPHLTMRALGALAEAGIEPLAFHELMRKVDLQFVLDEADFERAIGTLHAALVEQHREMPAEGLVRAA
ncbi:aspartate kinase [Geminicoccaceae bacterium 1502E]|nr:aspartate kinase [Geminicoccaceae bacterium 1502E]